MHKLGEAGEAAAQYRGKCSDVVGGDVWKIHTAFIPQAPRTKQCAYPLHSLLTAAAQLTFQENRSLVCTAPSPRDNLSLCLLHTYDKVGSRASEHTKYVETVSDTAGRLLRMYTVREESCTRPVITRTPAVPSVYSRQSRRVREQVRPAAAVAASSRGVSFPAEGGWSHPQNPARAETWLSCIFGKVIIMVGLRAKTTTAPCFAEESRLPPTTLCPIALTD